MNSYLHRGSDKTDLMCCNVLKKDTLYYCSEGDPPLRPHYPKYNNRLFVSCIIHFKPGSLSTDQTSIGTSVRQRGMIKYLKNRSDNHVHVTAEWKKSKQGRHLTDYLFSTLRLYSGEMV